MYRFSILFVSALIFIISFLLQVSGFVLFLAPLGVRLGLRFFVCLFLEVGLYYYFLSKFTLPACSIISSEACIIIIFPVFKFIYS